MHEVPGWDLDNDAWGFDVLTRHYEGSLPEFKKWRPGFTRATTDAEFPHLYCTGVKAVDDEKGGIVKAMVTFKGTLDRDPRPVFSSKGKLQSTHIKIRGGHVSMDVEYYAPVTTIRYVSHVQPKDRKYSNVLLRTSDDFQVINRRGAQGLLKIDANPEVLGTNNQYTATGVFFGKAVIIPLPMVFTPIGNVWQVEECNEGRIIDCGLQPIERS
jgi:hypothetical protein